MNAPAKRWVYTYLITLPDGRACTYSAFSDSETMAELNIKTRNVLAGDATFKLIEKIEDRRKGARREDFGL